jgi:hypothetical protein
MTGNYSGDIYEQAVVKTVAGISHIYSASSGAYGTGIAPTARRPLRVREDLLMQQTVRDDDGARR